jgi:hypothetical protein
VEFVSFFFFFPLETALAMIGASSEIAAIREGWERSGAFWRVGGGCDSRPVTSSVSGIYLEEVLHDLGHCLGTGPIADQSLLAWYPLILGFE